MNLNFTWNGTESDILNEDCNNHISKNDLESFRWFGIVIGILDIVVGGFGNGLTIAAFLTNRKLWSTFNIFIVNLSIIDFLTAVFMMPLHVVGYVLMEWPFPQWMCAFQAYIYFCCGYTSVVCLVAITLNRLVGIVYPLHYKRFFSSCRTSLAIVFCWFVAPLFLLPFLIFSNSDGTQMMGWREDQLLCTFTNLEPEFELYMKIMRLLFQFSPACIMIVSYTISVWDVSQTSSSTLLKPPTLRADRSRRTSRKSMDKSPSNSFSETR
ncbi:unnamed protein product [Oikopleura dioica]|uniref:G-protein coupled receptors family 1 profile domain-containing protein n=1 Tax=Oikopleura dioica TaxID=34765 RepID=E4WVJ1_OIKDI|nr:unnamed protein product [Oikopleura dioica]CBY37509.1 unnamed protein product [Oikopleura dioica]